jgi:hypothetical protein
VLGGGSSGDGAAGEIVLDWGGKSTESLLEGAKKTGEIGALNFWLLRAVQRDFEWSEGKEETAHREELRVRLKKRLSRAGLSRRQGVSRHTCWLKLIYELTITSSAQVDSTSPLAGSPRSLRKRTRR